MTCLPRIATIGLILMTALISAKAEEKRILILGDSLTAGYGLEKRLAYPSLIEERLKEEGKTWIVANAGVSGDTSAGGLQRLNWLLKKKADILLVALGGNDGLRGIDPEETRANLTKIVTTARETWPEIQIIIAGMEMPDNLGREFQEAFAAVFPEVAKETEVRLLPFLLEGVAGDEKLNLDDRVHPNEEGHKILAENVWKSLQPLLTEQTPSETPSS